MDCVAYLGLQHIYVPEGLWWWWQLRQEVPSLCLTLHCTFPKGEGYL